MSLTNSHDVINTLMVALFSAEHRRLTTEVDKLVEANREFFRDKPHDGFLFQGKPYDPSNLSSLGRKVRVSMSLHMNDRMEDFLRDKSQVDGDRKLISQILFPLIQPCSNLQDIRDTLPNCLVDVLPDLKGLPREQSVAFTLADNPRLFRQFENILPRVEFYAATRLLY
jgi:hypothetical protein